MKTIYGIKKYDFNDQLFVCFESYKDAYVFAESYDPDACAKLIVPIPCIENAHGKPQNEPEDEIKRPSDKCNPR